jgi:phosphorylcholine metabolism protein LicD
MKQYLLIIIVFFLLLVLLSFVCRSNIIKEPYEAIDLLETRTSNKIDDIVRRILHDMDGLFLQYEITYWIEDITLLDALLFEDISPWDDRAIVSILAEDEEKLIFLIPLLNQMGYGVVKTWSGYKVYPVNGINIKYYNRNWGPYEYSRELEDQEFFDYKYPFVDIYVMKKEHQHYDFANRYVKRIWPNMYYCASELLPLKRYQFNNFTVNGPNDPIAHIERIYGPNWIKLTWKPRMFQIDRNLPIVKGKVTPPLNKLKN